VALSHVSTADRAHRIVVLRALGLGDFLTAVPALRALRRGFPDSSITLASSPALVPLLPLTGALNGLRPVTRLGGLGRPDPRPDLLVNLHGRGPESIADAVASGARTVWTHAHPAYPDWPGPEWVAAQHEVARWCRLLEAYGLVTDRTDLELARPETPSAAPGAVVVHPGSTAAERRWPAERFGAVAAALAAAGHRVLVTGTAGEADLADTARTAAGLPPEASLAGRLDLAGLAALVADAALVVSGDTGVAHLASAYRTPSVVIFGPTSPALWGPPADGPHRVLWRASGTGLHDIAAAEVTEAALGLPAPL
jgi:ADP-heptose:LPS heptosyltransferase